MGHEPAHALLPVPRGGTEDVIAGLQVLRDLLREQLLQKEMALSLCQISPSNAVFSSLTGASSAKNCSGRPWSVANVHSTFSACVKGRWSKVYCENATCHDSRTEASDFTLQASTSPFGTLTG